MGAVLPFLAYFVPKIPDLISAGMDAAELIGNVVALHDANKVVGDPDWDALDAKVKELQAQARDTRNDVQT